jgi:hypothetical protein
MEKHDLNCHREGVIPSCVVYPWGCTVRVHGYEWRFKISLILMTYTYSQDMSNKRNKILQIFSMAREWSNQSSFQWSSVESEVTGLRSNSGQFKNGPLLKSSLLSVQIPLLCNCGQSFPRFSRKPSLLAPTFQMCFHHSQGFCISTRQVFIKILPYILYYSSCYSGKTKVIKTWKKNF